MRFHFYLAYKFIFKTKKKTGDKKMETNLEVIAVSSALLAVGSIMYTSYLQGRVQAIESLITATNRASQLIIIINLLPKYHKVMGKGSQRTFKTISLRGRSVRIGIAERKIVKRNGVSFDLYRTFQYHLHFGKYSVYISFSPLFIFDNVDSFRGRDVSKQV
jgi:hypothetical protein